MLRILTATLVSVVFVRVDLSLSSLSEFPGGFACKTVAAHAVDEPQFIKEGTLTFLDKTRTRRMATIDIEIADSEYERTRGLMYRTRLPENAGMLFIFEDSRPRSFWMRNTPLPLDIIFVDEKERIVGIHRKATPLSYAPIESKKKAKYVVEVHAGFCDAHGLSVGDFIAFKRGM